MRASQAYIQERFDWFNGQMFGGSLPRVRMRVSDAAHRLGVFMSPAGALRRDPRMCSIGISRRLDMPGDVLEDIIIHEMIHLSIWWRGIRDTGPHGKEFRALAEHINRTYGRHVTVRQRLDAETLDSDATRRAHYILVTKWRDGREGFTKMARTRIFDMFRAFAGHPGIESMKWYYSTDPAFNSYPSFRTPKYILLTPELRAAIARSCKPCRCDGRQFGPEK